MQRLINNHVEASKIGRQIAEEVLDSQKRGGDLSSGESSPEMIQSQAPVSTEVRICNLYICYFLHIIS